jgi:predicted nucleotidyltransferase
MDEQFEFLRLIVQRLDDAGISYMLTGSLALAVWARPRMTRDVDVVIDADKSAIAQLVVAFSNDCYASLDAAEDAVSSGTMFNVIHTASLLKADFILRRDEEYEMAKFERRRRVDVEGISVEVISPEDLILSKLLWGRDTSSTRQTEDVRMLFAEVGSLDETYLAVWAQSLGLTPALMAVRSNA